MQENVVWEKFDVMRRFIIDVFKEIGVPDEDAEVCADVIITADKRGIDSHGVGRFKPFYVDRIKEGIQMPVTNFEIVKDGPATAVVDGHHGMGQVIGKKSMQLAIEKAKKYGIGMVAVKNSTHYGIAGYYAMLAADQGMIGITGTNTRPSIAPTFGVENLLGTNPLAISLPTDEDFSFVLDFATSTITRGKVEYYDRAEKELPEGWVIDETGKSMTDPKQVLAGLSSGKASLTPLGGIGEEMAGYKGYGLATMVEIFCAALQNGKYLRDLFGIDENGKKVPFGIGHFFIAINISAFIELDTFKRITGDILRKLRACKKMPGHDRIYTAGEKEYLTWLDRKDKGIPLNKNMQNIIIKTRDEFGLTQHKFSFEQ